MLGPLFSLELVTSSRRSRYFLARVAYAVVLFFSLWVTYESTQPYALSQTQSAANVARHFFETYSYLQMGAILLLAPAMVASTVASERESRTLDYLLASQLSGVEIVLSKLAARLLHVIFVLSAGVPVLALATLMGGIETEKLLLVTALTLSTLLAVAGMSIAVSVWSRRTRDAVIKAYVLLLAFLIVPPVLYGILQSLGGIGAIGGAFDLMWLIGWVMQLNPFMLLMQMNVADQGVVGPWGHPRDTAQIVIAVQLVAAVLLALLAAFSVRRVHLATAGTATKRSRWRSLRLWRPPLGNHPMLWKELHAERGCSRLGWVAGLATVLLFLAILVPAALALGEALSNGRPRDFTYWAWGLGTTVGCVATLLAGVRGATSVTTEVERDCWTSLLSTPLAAREIFTAKVLGNIYAQRWLAALMVLLWSVACAFDPPFMVVVPFFAVTALVTTSFAASLGVWFSLAARNTLRALLATAGTLLFVGGGYMFCCTPCFIMVGGGGGEEILAFSLTACIPFLQMFPGIAWQILLEERGGGRDPLAIFTMAYLFGMLGYSLAAVTLWQNGVSEFDRRTGRARPRLANDYLYGGR